MLQILGAGIATPVVKTQPQTFSNEEIMKATVASAVLVIVLANLSCQPRAVPPATAPPPATTGAETSGPSSNGLNDAVQAPDSDQPDDPGMTRSHDKTLKQEQPSGDKSSRAAPNDGDAEPPQ